MLGREEVGAGGVLCTVLEALRDSKQWDGVGAARVEGGMRDTG